MTTDTASPHTTAFAEAPSRTSPDRHFATDHLLDDLKGRSVRGGAITIGAQGAKFVLQLVSTVVLARLLTPADFGLVAMVTALTGFVAMFKDAGLSMATVQRDQITHDQVSTLFWVNVALSAVLMVLVAASAPVIAWFYGKPELVAITLVTAGTFILGGLTVQHTALMKRQMRFTALATKDIVTQAAGIVVAITLAVLGAGYWALVAMPATGALAGMILAWLLSGWRPGLPKRDCGMRSLLGFGLYSSGSSFLVYFRRNLDNVLIGFFFGNIALGLYQKAFQLFLLPIQQINAPLSSAIIPALSRLRYQPERYRSYYSTAVSLMTSFTMPTVLFLAIFAEDVILIVLGKQWLEAIPLFIALLPAAFAATLNIASYWVFLSTGRVDMKFKLDIAITALVTLGLLIGVPWGPLGLAMGFSITTTVGVLWHIFASFQISPLRPSDLMSAITTPGVASLVAATAVLTLKSSGVLTDSRNLELTLLSTLFSLCYITAWSVLPGRNRRFNTLRSVITATPIQRILMR